MRRYRAVWSLVILDNEDGIPEVNPMTVVTKRGTFKVPIMVGTGTFSGLWALVTKSVVGCFEAKSRRCSVSSDAFLVAEGAVEPEIQGVDSPVIQEVQDESRQG